MSMLCTLAAGMLPRPSSVVGTPSTSISTLPLPRIDTCPLPSTVTADELRNTSSTDPVAAVTEADGLMLVFSTVTFLSAARPVTVMPLSCSVFSYHAAKLSGSATFPFAPVPPYRPILISMKVWILLPSLFHNLLFTQICRRDPRRCRRTRRLRLWSCDRWLPRLQYQQFRCPFARWSSHPSTRH